MPEHAHLVIVGCGAAGLMAAIHAGATVQAHRNQLKHHNLTSQTPKRIIALDGAKTIGAKILVAGGGRCNVTHYKVTTDDYYGSASRSIAKVLNTWPVDETVDWFAQHGVPLKKEDTGKLFPVTDKARTVLDALLGAAKKNGVELRHPCRVTDIQYHDQHFTLKTTATTSTSTSTQTHHNTPVLTCDHLILATGGKALPRTGSDGTAYTFARTLDHSITDTTPALVPLCLTGKHFLKTLSGQSLDATITVTGLNKRNKPDTLFKQRGPVLMTHFGLSGPIIMNASRHYLSQPGHTHIHMNVLDLTSQQADQQIQKASQTQGKTTVQNYLIQQFKLSQRFAAAVIEQNQSSEQVQATGLNAQTKLSDLSKKSRQVLVELLTQLRLPISGDRGYTYAEATAGGIPLNEIKLQSMQSKINPNLYLCGELLNVDGRIGGFNFQWAWCTGRLAGIHAASLMLEAPNTTTPKAST